MEYAQQALATARSVGDFGLEILAGVRLVLNYLFLGQYRQVIEILQRYMEALSGDLARERFEMASLPAVSGRVYLSVSLASLGEFTAAARASEEALAIAMAADHPYSVAHAWYGVGRTSAAQGNFGEAIPWLERSLDACRKERLLLLFHARLWSCGTNVCALWPCGRRHRTARGSGGARGRHRIRGYIAQKGSPRSPRRTCCQGGSTMRSKRPARPSI